MKVALGSQTRDARGRLGARTFVAIRDGAKWPGFFEFDTHGLTPEATAAKVRKIEKHHEKWAKRMDGFQAVLGVELVVDLDVYRIVDCTIPGTGDGETVTLVLGVRQIDGEKLVRLRGFPITLTYPSIEAVPTDAAIVAIVRTELEARASAAAKHETFSQAVNAQLAQGR